MSAFVSVIVPCYNSALYLKETAASVIAQDYPHWECIIINDGSTDNTADVALEIVHSDNRFQIIATPDVRLSASRNAGIRRSKGKYILPLDGDDKIAPNYISECVKALEANPELAIVYCEAELFGTKSGRWELPPFSFSTFAAYNIIFCTAMFRREAWEATGGYDERLKTGFEDWEFWISILSRGGEVLKLPFTGFYYRIRGNSLTSQMINNRFEETKSYVIQKHYPFFAKHLGDMITLYFERNNYRKFKEDIEKLFVYKLYMKLKSMA